MTPGAWPTSFLRGFFSQPRIIFNRFPQPPRQHLGIGHARQRHLNHHATPQTSAAQIRHSAFILPYAPLRHVIQISTSIAPVQSIPLQNPSSIAAAQCIPSQNPP
jgi:hypothetical protein